MIEFLIPTFLTKAPVILRKGIVKHDTSSHTTANQPR